MKNEKQVISVKGADAPASPLSPAISYGNLIFVSGTVSMDLVTRKPLPGTIEEETEQVIKNIETLLKQAGSSLDCVLKVTVFLPDIKDFAKMNGVYRKYFPNMPPARSTVGIQLAGPSKVEIEAIAYKP
jgi:2-iminobutanoate/2-iminopropanoate deaminase